MKNIDFPVLNPIKNSFYIYKLLFQKGNKFLEALRERHFNL